MAWCCSLIVRRTRACTACFVVVGHSEAVARSDARRSGRRQKVPLDTERPHWYSARVKNSKTATWMLEVFMKRVKAESRCSHTASVVLCATADTLTHNHHAHFTSSAFWPTDGGKHITYKARWRVRSTRKYLRLFTNYCMSKVHVLDCVCTCVCLCLELARRATRLSCPHSFIRTNLFLLLSASRLIFWSHLPTWLITLNPSLSCLNKSLGSYSTTAAAFHTAVWGLRMKSGVWKGNICTK